MIVVPDWSIAPEWARWWVYDFDGAGWWFEDEPQPGKFVWNSDSGRRQAAGTVTGWVVKQSWRNTKLQRPAQYR